MTRAGGASARQILALLQPCPAGLDQLSAADWAELDRIVARQRLQPLLHARHRDNPAVPEAIRAGWAQAYRAAALATLTIQADLADCLALLRAQGIEPLAMKGAWLAWHAYPHPAERPLRDLDLLVPLDRAREALELLQAAGWPLDEPLDLPIEQLLVVDKSPPPLIAPRGTPIELHWHAWFPAGRLDHFSPAPDDAGMFARARRGNDGVLYPCAEDMLTHLAVHGVYSHRLDCGPLLLPDIAMLLASGPLDWAGFWARAAREGWSSGARLVLDLVRRHCPEAAIDFTGAPAQTPPELLDAAAELLLQDHDTRLSAGVMAGGFSGLVRRLRREVRTADGTAVRRDSDRDGGYLAWAGSRLRRTLADLADPAVRRQSRRMAQISRWLDQ